jgi:hypothetical protein
MRGRLVCLNVLLSRRAYAWGSVAMVLGSPACDAPLRRNADAMTEEEAGGQPEPDAAGEELDATSPGMRDDASSGPADATPGLDAGSSARGLSFGKSSGATWEGTGQWQIEAKLSRAAERTERFELTTSGSASSASDYTLTSSFEIAEGQTAARLMLTIVDDREREARETLMLSVAGEPDASYALHIADDDDERWPTDDMVVEVDAAGAFPGQNLSGLVYAPARGATPAELWMIRNGGPSQLYRLRANGAQWSALSSEGWGQGKTLLFPNGGGAPDGEGITWADDGSPIMYVVSERDGIGASAPTVLSYDTSASAATLTATRAFDLTNDLRALMLGANTGPEALAWVPDSYLTSAGFVDEATGAPYDPARYPNHMGGLFFVGIEQTGGIYTYALDHTSGGATRVASIVSGQSGTMALEFDRDSNYLWAWCDDTCGNRASILRVEDNPSSPKKGRFGVRRSIARPSSLPDANHEGMTIAPASECSGNKKAVYWVEDGPDDHVLRRGTLPCGGFLDR